MQNEQVEFWVRELLDRLKCEVSEDSGDKIMWLVSHLEQYLGRWLGFAQSEIIKVEMTLSNETFYVVLATARVIDNIIDRVGCTNPFPQEEWEAFCATLECIQKKPNRPMLTPIIQSFEVFRDKMAKRTC